MQWLAVITIGLKATRLSGLTVPQAGITIAVAAKAGHPGRVTTMIAMTMMTVAMDTTRKKVAGMSTIKV
ncbi:hypothetical protein GCM10011403_08620 [Pseudohongiella nitratireducens]|uniref:Uncharacterized protein n=1 Tax=Pseudohongiella nitratireducens TaxID=1768907 RepID=A0A917GQN2_9GAMM|nr:hypothetical protein GCM10011403_08620 [Pseudohongiella nitratireducens]